MALKLKVILTKNNYDQKIETMITQNGHLTIIKFGDNIIYKTCSQIMQL